MKPFRARASKMGAYQSCLARGLFDRMAHEGVLEAPLEDEDKPYADMGTCIHFVMQDGIRAIFPKLPNPGTHELKDALVHFPTEALARQALATGDPRAFMYTPRQLRSAATLFGEDEARCSAAIRASATLGAKELPATPDGKPWLAEVPCETEWSTGHIDLLSQDNSSCIDIKSAQRPPDHGYMKPEHLTQLTVYQRLQGFRYARILYVDAKDAEWVMLSPEIDFHSEAMQEFGAHVEGYARLLQRPDLADIAFPQLGKHCSEQWCPHKDMCRQKFMPPAGVIKKLQKYQAPVGSMRL